MLSEPIFNGTPFIGVPIRCQHRVLRHILDNTNISSLHLRLHFKVIPGLFHLCKALLGVSKARSTQQAALPHHTQSDATMHLEQSCTFAAEHANAAKLHVICTAYTWQEEEPMPW